MDTRVSHRTKGQVTIVDIFGRHTVGQGDVALRAKVHELLGSGCRLFIFNMKKVPFMDSAGLGELVASVQLAKRFDSAIRLVKPQQPVLKVLEISRILPALEVHDSEEEAVAAFA